jgi:hypothetical protein
MVIVTRVSFNIFRRKIWYQKNSIITNIDIVQGDYIWIEPQSKIEFDVAIGARVIAAEGRRIQVIDDDGKVCSTIYESYNHYYIHLLKLKI